MLFEWMLDLGYILADFFIARFNDLPVVDPKIISVVDFILVFLEDSLNLIAFFVDMDLAKVVFPTMLLIINFEKVYMVVMWIARKVPFVGVE